MKILITGGCGFLGSNIASDFLKDDCEVVIVDSMFRFGSELNLNWLMTLAKNKQLSFEKMDIANYEDLESVFLKYSNFDYVCHVAGQVAMTTSLENPKRDLMTNVIGTFNVLECCRKYSPESVITYSSTNKVYGDLDWMNIKEEELRYCLVDYPKGLNEEIPLDFSTPYGCSKGSADQYVKDWARVYGLKTFVFRHSSIYGGRQFATFDQGWIGWFCKESYKQSLKYKSGTPITPFTISGTGKQVRDVLHANDLVNLYRKIYEYKDKINSDVFNIGGGFKNSLSLLELFNTLESILGIDKIKYQKIVRRVSDQDVFIADITKISNLIGWEPLVNVNQGLEKMILWCKEKNK